MSNMRAMIVVLCCAWLAGSAAATDIVKFEPRETLVCKGATVTIDIDIVDCDYEGTNCNPDHVGRVIPGWDLPCDMPPRIENPSSADYGHYKGTRTVVADWEGSKNFTIAVDDSGVPDDDPPPPNSTATITTVVVERIEAVGGATPIADGVNTPGRTDVCAGVKSSTEYVILRAVLTNNMAFQDLPEGWAVSWTGGEPYAEFPANSLMRQVSKESYSKDTLTAKLGSADTGASMIVYVIGAEPSNFSPANGTSGTHIIPDNCGNVGYYQTGVNLPVPSDGQFSSYCEMEFTAQPAVFISDGDAGVFAKSQVHWDVTRTARLRHWQYDIGYGSKWLNSPNTPYYHGDDQLEDDECDDPWANNGKLFSCDRPGPRFSLTSLDAYVLKFDMREWVRVGFGALPVSVWFECPDHMHWHAFRSIRKNGDGEWEPDVYGHEIAQGEVGWGTVPIPLDECTITGIVKNGSGSGIPGAVMYTDVAGYLTTSGAGGYYSVTLPAGTAYQITAYMESIGESRLGAGWPDSIDFRAGRPTPTPYDFELRPW